MLFFSLGLMLFVPWVVQKILCQSTPESELYTRLGWLFILFFLFDQTSNPWVLPVFYLFLLAGVIELWYVLIFRADITESSIEALFLTNRSESVEFLKSYFSGSDGFIVLTYLALTLSLFHLNVSSEPYFTHIGWLVSVSVLVAFIVYKVVFQQNFKDVIPGVLGMLPTYWREKGRTEKLILQRVTLGQGIADDAVNFAAPQEPMTHILVIGESASRRHQQLYGYERSTTPYQAGFQSELAVFENVISNFAQTNPSLSYMLTQAELDGDLSPDAAVSLIDIANKAGFETWWISNQEPSKSTPSAIAKCSHQQYFMQIEALLERFDEALLSKVAEAVLSSHSHKLIVVHLAGSHFQYKERYPESFNHFKTAENIQAFSPKISSKAIEIINQYDNSIRYTDFILSEIRGLLMQSGQPSLMAYLSDHGEEVFDTRNFKGHEPSNFTKPMFEIPFWVWASPAYQQRYPEKMASLVDKRHSPLVLEDVFHFVIDALDIKTTYLRHERSWWRNEFVARSRKVYDKDFDLWQS